MAMQAPRYGADPPCQACADRLDQNGVMAWSQIIRHYPNNRAATNNKMVLWLTRMLGARATCNECARLVNVLAIEFINIISNK